MKNRIVKYIVLMIICSLAMSFSISVCASSKKKIMVKKVSARMVGNTIKVKVRINNKFKKKEATYSEEFYVYKKETGKWKKINWTDEYGFDDVENVINPGTKVTKVFFVNQKYLNEKILEGKVYKIIFKVSGKKKSIKFKI